MRTGPLSELTIEAARQTIALVDALPRRRVFFTLGDQLLDSGTSQAANYRAVCRARSTPDFIAKLKIVEEGRTKAISGSTDSSTQNCPPSITNPPADFSTCSCRSQR